jgi:uncharacterized MnhB-related membrane protein
MLPLQLALFALLAIGGAVTVLTRNLRRQVLLFSLYGMSLTILFVVLQSPDVALSELTVGAAALPLMLLVAINSVKHTGREKE